MEALAVFVFALFVFAFFSAIGAGFLMLAWDFVVPALFGLPEITFWQAFALFVLVRMLFGFLRSSST